MLKTRNPGTLRELPIHPDSRFPDSRRTLQPGTQNRFLTVREARDEPANRAGARAFFQYWRDSFLIVRQVSFAREKVADRPVGNFRLRRGFGR